MIDITTYLNRITSQHKTKPNFMALLEARLQPFIDLAECLGAFDAAFDLDNAIGAQLDIIGRYVGVERLLNFQPQTVPALLPDVFYRMLLKARISLNNWDGTTAGIQQIWEEIFPNYTIDVVDNQDMTMFVRITGMQDIFESEIVQHGYIVPKPMGVLINFSVIFQISLEGELFIGGLAISETLRKNLPAPPPTDNTLPQAELFIGGLYASRSGTSTLGLMPITGDFDLPEATLFAGGLLMSNELRFSLASAQP
jgi:hypothetical protein